MIPLNEPGDDSRDIHRIGGGSVDNLRLKPKEAALAAPGISVLQADRPGDVARQVRFVFPRATGLHAQARVIGSTSAGLIRAAGFGIIQAPTRMLPNHYRLVHPGGAAGFGDENLARLAAAFLNTTVDTP